MLEPQVLKKAVVMVLWAGFLFLFSSNKMLAQDRVAFAAHQDFVAGDGPKLFARGDLNGDGITDFITPNSTLNFQLVSVLLGNGDGSFQPVRNFASGGFGTVAAVVADFDGDSKQDVAVASKSGVSVLLGNGTGNLGAPKTIADNSLPQALAAA